MPTDEKYMMVCQVKRSSGSITAAMAEGYGRYTFTDTGNFFIIARGSITETMEHLSTAFDEGYISEVALKTGEEMCGTSCKLINGYISWLDKSKANAKTASSPIPNS